MGTGLDHSTPLINSHQINVLGHGKVPYQKLQLKSLGVVYTTMLQCNVWCQLNENGV